MRLRMFVGIVAAMLFTFAVWPSAAAQAAGGTTGAPTGVVAEKAPPSGANAVKLGAGAQKVDKARVSKTKPVGAGNPSAQWIYCYDAYLGPDYYHVTCNSDQWYTPWVQCSDGLWYAYASFLGHWSIWTFCPAGLTATAGVVTY
jgi:hypothetical protein